MSGESTGEEEESILPLHAGTAGTHFVFLLWCAYNIMPSCLSQHSFITARTEGLFNPVKDISVATVSEARRLVWYQGFPYEPG